MKNKILVCSLMAGLMAFNFAGCGKKAEETKTETPAAEAPKTDAQKVDYCTKSADDLKALVKDANAGATAEELKTIYNAYSCCKIDKDKLAIDTGTCNADKAIAALKKDKVKLPHPSEIAADLVKSESPVVRAMGYRSIPTKTASFDKNIELAKSAIKTEKDDFAIKTLISVMVNQGNKYPELGKYFVEAAKHENPLIREEAAKALGNHMSDKVEGAVDTVIALMDDKEQRVRNAAYVGSGKLGDEKVIDPLVKVLNDPAMHKSHSFAMNGLLSLWLDFPKFEHTSEKAYKASLDYLKIKPRTKDVPSWMTINGFTLLPRTEKAFAEWTSKAAYYKADEIISAMTDIVKDDKADRLARTACVTAIGKLGGAASLEKLKPAIDKLKDSQAKSIQDTYKSELEKAQKKAAK